MFLGWLAGRPFIQNFNLKRTVYVYNVHRASIETHRVSHFVINFFVAFSTSHMYAVIGLLNWTIINAVCVHSIKWSLIGWRSRLLSQRLHSTHCNLLCINKKNYACDWKIVMWPKMNLLACIYGKGNRLLLLPLLPFAGSDGRIQMQQHIKIQHRCSSSAIFRISFRLRFAF